MDNIYLLPVFLLDSLPFSYFLYKALRRHLKYKRSALTFLAWLGVTAAVACFFFFLTYLPFFTHETLRLYRLGASMTLLALLLVSVNKAKGKTAFAFFLIMPFSLGFSELAAFISQYIETDAPPYAITSLVRFITIALLYPIMIFMWEKMDVQARRITDPVTWNYLWPIPFCSSISSILLMDRNFEFSPPNLSDLLGRVAVWVGNVAICWLLFHLANRFEQRVHLQDLSERSDMLLTLQAQQYADLAASVEEARAARHDLRHHLGALKTLSEDGEHEQLRLYIDEISEGLPSERRIKVCENYAANAVLDHYIRKANSLDIPIKINMRLPNAVGISDADLCVILGNSVENALEATAMVPEEERFISISALSEGDRLYITVDNSFDGTLKTNRDDGVYLSRKRDFRLGGVGIGSIKAAVAKYNGQMKIEAEDKIFRLSLMLNKL